MSLLKITPADIQKSKLLNDGWYGLTLKSCTDWEPAKPNPPKPPSLNMTFTFVVEGENEKEVSHLLNSSGIGFHIGLLAAFLKTPVKKIQDDPTLLESFDPQEYVGQKIDGHIIVDNFQGRNNNKISAFLPYGQGRAQAATSVY